MTSNISRTKVKSLIDNAKGTYKVTFKKVNGTLRDMNAKQGVEHNLKGGVNRVIKPSNNYITTFDVDKQEYRTINLATITKLTVNNINYEVI